MFSDTRSKVGFSLKSIKIWNIFVAPGKLEMLTAHFWKQTGPLSAILGCKGFKWSTRWQKPENKFIWDWFFWKPCRGFYFGYHISRLLLKRTNLLIVSYWMIKGFTVSLSSHIRAFYHVVWYTPNADIILKPDSTCTQAGKHFHQWKN